MSLEKFPKSFIAQLHQELGQKATALLSVLGDAAPVSIRYNPQKIWFEPQGQPVLWEPMGRYLKDRPKFTLEPWFHGGLYYVQEASSMMLGEVFRQLPLPSRSRRILDLCAAPGGKSTHLATLKNEEDLLVSNEVIRSRVAPLEENLTKWGAQNVVITHNDPADFHSLPHFFDLIVVDAPCSGEGLFRRDAAAVSEWSPEHVAFCASRQERILNDIWPVLAPGGFLVYSTCTFNKTENEQVVKAFTEQQNATFFELESEGLPLIVSDDVPVYRCLPSVMQGEGFTFSIIQKHADSEPAPVNISQRSSAWRLDASQNLVACKGWLQSSHEHLYTKGDMVRTWSHPDIIWISERLRVISAGIEVASKKGNEWKPMHGLAMSSLVKKDAFPHCELSLEEALMYLRREVLRREGLGKGYYLLTYESLPLGFAKSAGNRLNNHYPMNWRIRMR